jgi:hypothetical protein
MHMKNVAILVVYLALLVWPNASKAQIDTPRVPPEVDLRDLSERASNSQFVVVGRVLTTKVVHARVSPGDLAALKASFERGGDGFLFAVKVDNILCRSSDFRTDTFSLNNTLGPDNIAYIFVPSDAPPFDGPYRAEYLLRGRQYLLFLHPMNAIDQKRWTSELTLDPTQTYYRASEYSRGAILLPPPNSDQPASPVLEKATKLCAAVRPPTFAEKIASLRQLANSADSVLSKEAEITIKSLESQKPMP